MYIVICYVAYLAISLAVTIWVAQTLRQNGRSFLVDAFHGNRELADSINHLLVVGFYLINVGYVTLFLHTYTEVATARSAIELVCDKPRPRADGAGNDAFSQSLCLQPDEEKRTG